MVRFGTYTHRVVVLVEPTMMYQEHETVVSMDVK